MSSLRTVAVVRQLLAGNNNTILPVSNPGNSAAPWRPPHNGSVVKRGGRFACSRRVPLVLQYHEFVPAVAHSAQISDPEPAEQAARAALCGHATAQRVSSQGDNR